MLEMYAQVYEDLLAVPVVRGRKSDKEKFAVSWPYFVFFRTLPPLEFHSLMFKLPYDFPGVPMYRGGFLLQLSRHIFQPLGGRFKVSPLPGYLFPSSPSPHLSRNSDQYWQQFLMQVQRRTV